MAELISSIAQLLWPLIALAALFVFRRAIGRVLRTAERRELEFEVGGQKLTMRELNDQQNEMIQDLQRQLSVVSKELDARKAAAPVTVPPIPAGTDQPDADHANWPVPDGEVELPQVQAPSGPEPFAVLWVAERPETHALLVQQLRDNGVRVTMVGSTVEALGEVAERPYRLIVSDMSRKEDGRYRMEAGLALLRELRDLGVEIPVVLFCSPRAQQQYGAQARQLGAVATTSSAYEMFTYFQNFDLL